MPFDSYEDNSDDSVESTTNDIDPRDTYGSRFAVTSRRISNAFKPRSAITSSNGRLKNSDKIFTKHHDRENLGGNVNMKNINRAKEKKLVSSSQADDIKVSKTGKMGKKKSSGLDSLFESTSKEQDDVTYKPESVFDSESTAKINMLESRKETTQEKYHSQSQNRPLKVIKPISYNSAKEISTALKAGSAVVICLKGINPETSKRILDFSFGAASMCGAKVSVEAEKTYVITIGPGLSQREKLLCIKEGVALKVDK